MDRRTVLAVVLSVGIYYTWLALRGGPPELVEPPPEPVVTAPAPVSTVPAPTDAPSRELALAACGLRATVHTDGGGMRGATLPGVEGPLQITPIYAWILGLFTGGEMEWHPYGDEIPPEALLTAEAQALVAGSGNPATSARRFEVRAEGEGGIELRSVAPDGVEVVQRYVPTQGDETCTFTVETTWTNGGSRATEPGELWVGMFDRVKPAGGMFAFYDNTEKVYARTEGDLEYAAWSEPDEGKAHEPERLDDPADWIAIADRYHGLFAIPSGETKGSAAWARYGVGEDALDGVIWSPPVELAPGESHTAAMRVFAGTHDYAVLEKVDPTLVDIVDFGFVAVFAWPLLWALRLLQGGLGNWGVAIVVLTLIVKGVFFPLNQSAFKSAEKMKVIQPLMNEIREKYKDNQEEAGRKQMELFREHQVNPLGGCLPMIIQMPVFFALFYVLMYSADLYHTEFLYLRDLSSPDPYCVLPTVVVGLMMLQQQFTPMGNMDPAQARMMKLMPLMFGVFWFLFPSGLVVYYFVNTGLSILQQWWIRRSFDAPPSAVSA